MNTSRFGLPPITVERICGVLAQHPQVAKAVLYGSRAKGNYKNGSDIDLTLVGDGLGFDELLKIMGELDDLLLPYTIDHNGLRGHIQRVGQEFYLRQATSKPLQPA